MKDQAFQVLLALIAIFPATTTIVVSIIQDRHRKADKYEQQKRDERNAAKSSIQNMITQDIIRAEILGRIPENRDNIEDEYDVYHKNGGNGTITRQVEEYRDWIEQFRAAKIKNSK